MMIAFITIVVFVQSVTLGLVIKIARDMGNINHNVKFRLEQFEIMIRQRITAFLEVFKKAKS
jgi:hypothetical protein